MAGDVPDGLAVILANLLDNNFLTSITGKITGPLGQQQLEHGLLVVG